MSIPTPFGRSISLVSTYTPDRSNYITLPNSQVFNPTEALSLHPSLKYFIFKASWSFVDENTKESRTNTCYLSWAGQYTESNPQVVSIPSHLGDSLKIPRGVLINLQLVIPPTPTAFLSLTPLSNQDYSIAELNKGYITDNLLSLVSLINLDKPLRIWVRGSLINLTPSLIPAAKKDSPEAQQAQPPIALIAPNTLVEIVTVKPDPKDEEDDVAPTTIVDVVPTTKPVLTPSAPPPSFPNLLVTIVPLPSLAPELNPHSLHKATIAASKAAVAAKKDLSTQPAAAPSPLSTHLKTSAITHAYEEPTVCDGTIFVSDELYQMLGFETKMAQQSSKPTKSPSSIHVPQNVTLPVAILRTNRQAKAVPSRFEPQSRIIVDKIGTKPPQRLPNYDPLEDFHMPFPTPIEPFVNSVISVNRVQIHPALKGLVIALHSLQAFPFELSRFTIA